MSVTADFIIVEAKVPEHLEDHLPELLVDLTVLGSEIGAVDDDGLVALKIYLAADDEDGARAVEVVLGDHGGSEIGHRLESSEDWMAAYREVVTPMAIGRSWWLDPHPHTPTPAPEGRIRLAIEPRMAFGTGSHETTQLVLQAIEDRDLEGDTVLDMGTGSGILALACLARRASWVLGADIDAQSVWVARETAHGQDDCWRPRYVVGTMDCIGCGVFDLVLCNMISERFLPLLPGLVAALGDGGTLLLSGLLDQERSEIEAAVVALGARIVREQQLAEWMCLEVRR